MQLTMYTDYALRTLIYLGANPEGASVAHIATTYNISRNHLVKVAHRLGQLGYISATRGKFGGIRLAKESSDINLGVVVREVEPNFNLVECFSTASNRCPITGVCKLRGVLHEAQKSFFGVLDGYTLSDLVQNPDELKALLGR